MKKYADYDDEMLIALLAKDDDKALSALYDRHWEKMLIRANFVLASPEEAEEVVHDVFLQLWARRREIIIRYTVHTYLASIVKYKCYRLLAARKHRPSMTFGDSLSIQSVDDSTRQWLNYAELRDDLETAIEQLPEKCRLIFRLSRDQGLTDREIAESLGLAPKTVRTQIYRALQKLKASLRLFFGRLPAPRLPAF